MPGNAFSKNHPITLKMAFFATEHKNTFLDISHVEVNIFELISAGTRDLHSFLRNELISKTLYLCKDVETFGSGLRKIYALCQESGVKVGYIDSEKDFTIEFSRVDRNIMPQDDTINGTITKLESEILDLLRKDEHITIAQLVSLCCKSQLTITMTLSYLKSTPLIERVVSNKSGILKAK